MWAAGLRYRKHCKDIPGNPDFCFRKKRIAIFCDSEFWHGKNFLEGQKFKTNADYWEPKIQRNIERDKQINMALEKASWSVLRFWGKDIDKTLDDCVQIVMIKVQGK